MGTIEKQTGSDFTDEIKRIKTAYEKRKSLPSDLYSESSPYYRFSRLEFEKVLKICLYFAGIDNLERKKLLEIGAGYGTNLDFFIKLGFAPSNLTVNELLEDRITELKRRFPAKVEILSGEASALNLPDESFDIVFQSLVFSSILNIEMQKKIAEKMWRLTRPGGGVLWYDFIYNNPKNKDVRGIPVRRITELFPSGIIESRMVTLAPPIGRLTAGINENLYKFFNLFPFLRTHVVCWIHKNG